MGGYHRMRHALFPSLELALAFDASVSAAMGWPSVEQKTDRYAIAIKHPSRNEWAVPVRDYAEPHLVSGTQIVEELTPDWYPPDRNV